MFNVLFKGVKLIGSGLVEILKVVGILIGFISMLAISIYPLLYAVSIVSKKTETINLYETRLIIGWVIFILINVILHIILKNKNIKIEIYDDTGIFIMNSLIYLLTCIILIYQFISPTPFLSPTIINLNYIGFCFLILNYIYSVGKYLEID